MVVNPLMHNNEKWSNILQKFCSMNTARLLKFVWSFLIIMHEWFKPRSYHSLPVIIVGKL